MSGPRTTVERDDAGLQGLGAGPDEELGELVDLDVHEVSLVDAAANRRRFLVVRMAATLASDVPVQYTRADPGGTMPDIQAGMALCSEWAQTLEGAPKDDVMAFLQAAGAALEASATEEMATRAQSEIPEAARVQIAELERRLQAEVETREIRDRVDVARRKYGRLGQAEQIGRILYRAQQLPEAERTALGALLDSAEARLAAVGEELFVERGSAGSPTSVSPQVEIERLAVARVTARQAKNIHEAREQVVRERPDLYAAYRAEVL
jgi:hypothetical protein